MKYRSLTFILFIALAGILGASPEEFDFKDPKGVNNVSFKTEAPVETIKGSASGITGKVTFDPANPGAVRGKIVVATPSMRVPNPKMQQHLHSGQWLDAAKYPEIIFEVVSAKDVKTEGDTTTANVLGRMTIKGTTREITVPVKMTYLKDKLKQRSGVDGDLLVLRANFNVKRSDFGINPGQMLNKVSDDIQLTLGVAGSAPRG
ncbi:MAG TPA: YceI family protein [Verrucomicrobiae bacterium]|nr:YceI family protein [Verrucomicrobiae bacterium]